MTKKNPLNLTDDTVKRRIARGKYILGNPPNSNKTSYRSNVWKSGMRFIFEKNGNPVENWYICEKCDKLFNVILKGGNAAIRDHMREHTLENCYLFTRETLSDLLQQVANDIPLEFSAERIQKFLPTTGKVWSNTMSVRLASQLRVETSTSKTFSLCLPRVDVGNMRKRSADDAEELSQTDKTDELQTRQHGDPSKRNKKKKKDKKEKSINVSQADEHPLQQCVPTEPELTNPGNLSEKKKKKKKSADYAQAIASLDTTDEGPPKKKKKNENNTDDSLLEQLSGGSRSQALLLASFFF